MTLGSVANSDPKEFAFLPKLYYLNKFKQKEVLTIEQKYSRLKVLFK